MSHEGLTRWFGSNWSDDMKSIFAEVAYNPFNMVARQIFWDACLDNPDKTEKDVAIADWAMESFRTGQSPSLENTSDLFAFWKIGVSGINYLIETDPRNAAIFLAKKLPIRFFDYGWPVITRDVFHPCQILLINTMSPGRGRFQPYKALWNHSGWHSTKAYRVKHTGSLQFRTHADELIELGVFAKFTQLVNVLPDIDTEGWVDSAYEMIESYFLDQGMDMEASMERGLPLNL